MRKCTFFILIVIAVVFIGPKLLGVALHTKTPIAAISSSSMWPVLKRGDMVLIFGVQKDDIKKEDIVVYKNEKGFTIHRVAELRDDYIITKGDANSFRDSPIEYEKIVGKAVEWKKDRPVRIPKLGYISILSNAQENNH